MEYHDKNSFQWQRARYLKTGQTFWVVAKNPEVPHEGAPESYLTNFRFVDDATAVFIPSNTVELLPEFANGREVEWQWRGQAPPPK